MIVLHDNPTFAEAWGRIKLASYWHRGEKAWHTQTPINHESLRQRNYRHLPSYPLSFFVSWSSVSLTTSLIPSFCRTVVSIANSYPKDDTAARWAPEYMGSRMMLVSDLGVGFAGNLSALGPPNGSCVHYCTVPSNDSTTLRSMEKTHRCQTRGPLEEKKLLFLIRSFFPPPLHLISFI